MNDPLKVDICVITAVLSPKEKQVGTVVILPDKDGYTGNNSAWSVDNFICQS